LQVDDVCAGSRVRDRGTVIQKKTGRPVQFEIMEQPAAYIITAMRAAIEAEGIRSLFGDTGAPADRSSGR
jgi:hypothetical protein